MTLSDFTQLKNLVVETIVSSENHSYLLHSLKELFRDDINSIRRFEQICSIRQLLSVLEIRGVLSEDNVQPLKNIAKKINNSKLLVKVDEYEESHIPREYGNYYESERSGNRTLSPETIQNTNPFESNIMKKKKDRIIRTVVEEIGGYWKDLGRSLNIREHVIDDIEHNHRTLATKALKIMEKFDSLADKQKWFFLLCDALDRIHRKELANTLQGIMMMNI